MQILDMGIGLMEILIVVIVLLLFFGPNKPAVIAKSFKEGVRNYKNSRHAREVEYRDISNKNENKKS